MKYRILIFLFFLSATFVGVPWYFLANSRHEKIRSWREISHFFLNEVGDLSRAEDFTDRVLEVLPKSPRDKIFKVMILQRRGSPEDLREALGVLDALLESRSAPRHFLELQKALNYRRLGDHARAYALALSVLDLAPLRATMELGITALGALAPVEALTHFRRAAEQFATSDLERAWAYEGVARAQFDLARQLEFSIPDPDRAPGPDGDGASVAAAVEKARPDGRQALARSLRLVAEVPEDFAGKQRVRMLMAQLAEQQSDHRARAERPCQETALLLESRIQADRGFSKELSRVLLTRLGRLWLRAAREVSDGDAAGKAGAAGESSGTALGPEAVEALARAERYFVRIFESRSPAAMRTLIGSGPLMMSEEPVVAGETPTLDPQVRARREYLTDLIGVVQAYLVGPDHGRLLDDPSSLALSRPLDDAAESPDGSAAAVFVALRGLASLRSGDVEAAFRDLDRAVERIDPENPSRVAVELALRCAQVAPGSPIVFHYLDRFDDLGGRPFEEIGSRVEILRLASRSAALAVEAKSRIERALARGAAAAESPREYSNVVALVRAIQGTGPAVEVLRGALAGAVAGDAALRFQLGSLLHAKAEELSTEVNGPIPSTVRDVYLEALGHYLTLYVEDPLQVSTVPLVIVRILESMRAGADEVSIVSSVRQAFPRGSDRDLEALGRSLFSFFLQDFAAALERSGEIRDSGSFQPFLSYLRGVCHAEMAARLRGTSPGRGDLASGQQAEETDTAALETRRAKQRFRQSPGYLASRLELANLDISDLAAQEDVPQRLLSELDGFSNDPRSRHGGPWLLYRALVHRLQFRLRDPAARTEHLDVIVRQLRDALRLTIRRQPRYSSAQVGLADSFVVGRFVDGPGGNETPGAGVTGRVQLSPDYDTTVGILKSVSAPGELVFSRLAQYLALAGNAGEAWTYLTALTLVTPSLENFVRLVQGTLARGVFDDSARLLAPAPGLDPVASPSREQGELLDRLDALLSGESTDPNVRLRLVVVLLLEGSATSDPGDFASAVTARVRERMQAHEEYDAHRLMYQGEMRVAQLARENTEAGREVLRDEVLEAYGDALAEFDRLGVPPPLLLLNNYAWQLADHHLPARQAAALEVAARARSRVPDRETLPAVHDTYAWALFKAGQAEEAERELRSLLEQVDEPSFHYHHAEVCLSLEKLGEARSAIDRALEPNVAFDGRERAVRLRGRIQAAFGRLRASGRDGE